MLIHVKSKENDVDPVKMLEHDNAFAAKWKFIWVLLVGIALFHEFPNFKLSVHSGNLPDGDGPARFHIFQGIRKWDIL